MAKCVAKNTAGVVCGIKSQNNPYFWYRDPFKRIDADFEICQKDSDTILRELMSKEDQYLRIIKKLKQQIDNAKYRMKHIATTTEQREATKHALESGLPRPKFKNEKAYINEQSELWKKIKKFSELRNIERNKICRYCGFPLREPDDPANQIGDQFSHADFHSTFGHGRAWIMFHTECGISWILGKIFFERKHLKGIKPQLIDQGVLFKK